MLSGFSLRKTFPHCVPWRWQQWLALFGLVLTLSLVNYSIVKQETLLAEGEVVFLQLAPVDPRSLMQGDYMALRFDIERKLSEHLGEIGVSDGKLVAKLDKQRVARFLSLYSGQALSQQQILMRYRIRNGQVKFATNAFFFEEGSAEKFEQAEYGQFRVGSDGELLLAAMYDAYLKQIQ